MKNLFDFAESLKSKPIKNQEDKTKNFNEKVEDIYSKYKDKSSEDLKKELFQEIARSKREGTYDFEQINNSIKQIIPFLNADQKNNLDYLLKQINDAQN